MTLPRLISFISVVAGSFYVLMTVSLVLHEMGGHLLAGALCGARSFSFAVTPGFAGWAQSDYIRSSSADFFVQYAGIGINAVVGLSAFAILGFRRPHLTPLSVVLFWLAVTESGHAMGYSLQGLLFGQGDAGTLPNALHPIVRVLTSGVLIAVFLLLAAWALRTIVGFVKSHFRPNNLKDLRRAHFLAFVLPLTILILIAPGLPGRALWTQLVFDGAVVAVLIVASLPVHPENLVRSRTGVKLRPCY